MKALESHELNFYTKYIVDPEKIHKRNVLILYSLPVIVLVGVLAYIVSDLVIQKAELENEVSMQLEELSDPDLLESYEKASNAYDNLAVLDSEISGMEMFGHIKDTYPKVGKDDINKILECTLPEVRVTGISFEPSNGTVRIEAESDDVTVIPKYIDELKKTGLLVNADYSGYMGNEVRNAGVDENYLSYHISVDMKVNTPETDFDFDEYYMQYGEDEYSDGDEYDS